MAAHGDQRGRTRRAVADHAVDRGRDRDETMVPGIEHDERASATARQDQRGHRAVQAPTSAVERQPMIGSQHDSGFERQTAAEPRSGWRSQSFGEPDGWDWLVRAPMKATDQLPAAAPAKTSVSASPTVGDSRPCRQHEAGNAGNTMRVALVEHDDRQQHGKAKRAASRERAGSVR